MSCYQFPSPFTINGLKVTVLPSFLRKWAVDTENANSGWKNNTIPVLEKCEYFHFAWTGMWTNSLQLANTHPPLKFAVDSWQCIRTVSIKLVRSHYIQAIKTREREPFLMLKAILRWCSFKSRPASSLMFHYVSIWINIWFVTRLRSLRPIPKNPRHGRMNGSRRVTAARFLWHPK